MSQPISTNVVKQIRSGIDTMKRLIICIVLLSFWISGDSQIDYKYLVKEIKSTILIDVPLQKEIEKERYTMI